MNTRHTLPASFDGPPDDWAILPPARPALRT
jgi:hypothetical protein